MGWIVIPARPFRDLLDDEDALFASAEYEFRSVAIRADQIAVVEYAEPDRSVVILSSGSGYECELPLNLVLESIRKASEWLWNAAHKRN